MDILVKDYITDGAAVSYDDGYKCYQDILKYLDKEEVILDFKEVDYVITAFLNPIIGDLILSQGKDVMKKIGIRNADDSVLSKIKLVKDGTLVKVEDLEEE